MATRVVLLIRGLGIRRRRPSDYRSRHYYYCLTSSHKLINISEARKTIIDYGYYYSRCPVSISDDLNINVKLLERIA